MRCRNVKNDIFVAIRCVVQPLNKQKLVFGRELRWRSLRRSPKPIVGWGGGHPLHTLPPRHLRRLDLGAFSASVSRPPTQIPGYPYGLPHFFLAYSWPTLSKKPGAARVNNTTN